MNAESAEVFSVSIDLTRALAKRVGAPVNLALFDTAGKLREAVRLND
jgi:hypothetical protein